MKKVIRYQCSICKKLYDTKRDARKCEKQKMIKPYPIGLIFTLLGETTIYGIIDIEFNSDHSYHYICFYVDYNDTKVNLISINNTEQLYSPNLNCKEADILLNYFKKELKIKTKIYTY